MTTKDRFAGFLQDAALNVSAADALHLIRDQIEVCRLAVIGLSGGEEGPAACSAVASLLFDLADAVSALGESPRLDAASAA